MAIKVKFEVGFSKALSELLKNNKKVIDSDTAKEVGEETIQAMKDRILAGQSPIEGKGKFERYKNPDKYPGKRKPKSPVNLRLSGDFLDALTHEVKSGDSGMETYIFYEGSDGQGVSNDVKEQGHRKGANGQPERPTLPQDQEKFHVNIRKVYTDIYRKRILDVLKGKG